MCLFLLVLFDMIHYIALCIVACGIVAVNVCTLPVQAGLLNSQGPCGTGSKRVSKSVDKGKSALQATARPT